MELLRRALLVGCVLPGLWLLRLATLDPLLTVVRVDFAARQRQEAASVPEDRKSEAEKRRALIALPVYVEEVVQYNVFPAVGPQWDRLLGGIDDLEVGKAAGSGLGARTSADLSETEGSRQYVFFRSDEEPLRDVLDKLAQGGGTTFISISRPGEDRHYKVDRRTWTRRDFRPGAGFTGKPAPTAHLLYPFRNVALALALSGVVLFVLCCPARIVPECAGSHGPRDGRPGGRPAALRPSTRRRRRLGPGAHPGTVADDSVLVAGLGRRALLRSPGTKCPRRTGTLDHEHAVSAGRAGLPGNGARPPRLPHLSLDDPLEPLRG